MEIQLPDGSIKSYPDPVTPHQVAADIGPKLAEAAVGAKVRDQLWDVNRPIEPDDSDSPVELSIITRPRTNKKGLSKGDSLGGAPDALYLLRHSCAHVMAEAIQRIWPQALLAYGPPLDNGFYYDIYLEDPISSDDFPRIEEEMRKIVAEDRPFSRYQLDTRAGLEKVKDEGNKYKIDNARRAVDGGASALSWYLTGPKASDSDIAAAHKNRMAGTPCPEAPWEDLCMGPHVPSTGVIGAFKVTSVASSYWHGDADSDRFQRVYGTAFYTEADLEKYLEQLEEARQRDHRVVGQRLGLFAIDEKVGQGLVLWKPRGAVIRDQLQKFIMKHLVRQGYQQVFTPHIGKLELYRTSGHFPYYSESQFPPLIDHEQMRKLADESCNCAQLSNLLKEGQLDGYLLKPMNCPNHIRIYASDKHSYRDLPIRLAEFGTVYRWEQSGELGGMTRVRGFTQDDAHLFVTEDQLGDEVMGCLELVKIIFKTLDMNDYRVRVGMRDPDNEKYAGESEQWDAAESACIAAAESLGVPFTTEPGEAAFYGPKIDFVVKDVIGREWQLGTVQVDYQLPQRFDLSYVGADNKEHRPIMIHRAPFGSMERFIGCLIEHFNGAFPLWLSPEQVRVLPVSDKFTDYAQKVLDALIEVDLRATMDASNDRLNAKIKVAQDAKVNYMLVVGGRDQEAGTVSVRDRARGDLGALPLEQFVEQSVEEVTTFGGQVVSG